MVRRRGFTEMDDDLYLGRMRSTRRRSGAARLVGSPLSVLATVLGMLSTRDAFAQCDPNTVGCPSPRTFRIHAFDGMLVKNGGKCLDYLDDVAGAPIVLNDCSRAHAFTVEELPVVRVVGGVETPLVNHVRLRAGDKIVGARGAFLPSRNGGVRASPLQSLADAPLVLQDASARRIDGRLGGSSLREQEFILDGDSIMLAANRDLVAKVANGRGKVGTPIVLGPRQLAQAELWEFRATDGSGADPTTRGFVNVATLDELLQYLDVFDGPYAPTPAAPGTVLRITASFSIDLPRAVKIPAEVTLRGDRRGITLGPELSRNVDEVMFSLQGDWTRITNLRLRGPNTARDKEDLENQSIGVAASDAYHAILDHIDGGDWYGTPIAISGKPPHAIDELCISHNFTNNVRVSRNFLHHNLMDGYGYGVNAKADAYPLIDGNTFLWNRHAIAMTHSSSKTGYRAWSNLVLERVPQQNPVIFEFTHDFDIHGFGANADDGFGGVGGDYADIARNTFLGTDRYNFKLRGVPCQYVDFRENVTIRPSQTDALAVQLSPLGIIEPNTDDDDILHVQQVPNQFDHENPTNKLATGDFDGDGSIDLFLATGASWYYAPGGRAEWRLLSGDKNDLVDTLRFGDFDGDGRTDVIGKNGSSVMVSWGGASDWDLLNPNPIAAPISDLAVGDFDGDSIADIFYADGESWWISPRGTEQFVFRNTSGFRVSQLRFGDFNRSGTTDVFGVVGGYWQFSAAGSSPWHPLHEALSATVDDLYVADFDGDNRDDIVWREPAGFGIYVWMFSLAGLSDPVPITVTSNKMAAMGEFLEAGRAKVLFWDANTLYSAGWEAPMLTRHSRQDMR